MTSQTFLETGKQVCGTFLRYRREHSRLVQQGLPLTNDMTTTGINDPVGRHRQFFERANQEHHNAQQWV